MGRKSLFSGLIDLLLAPVLAVAATGCRRISPIANVNVESAEHLQANHQIGQIG
jgi:hypothetical protein